jgi:hypothetical protein
MLVIVLYWSFWNGGVSGSVYVLSPMVFSSPVLWPSCLTPMVQHFAGGLEDMLFSLVVRLGFGVDVLELWWVARGVVAGSFCRVVDILIKGSHGSISGIGTMLCNLQFEVTVTRQSVSIRLC